MSFLTHTMPVQTVLILQMGKLGAEHVPLVTDFSPMCFGFTPLHLTSCSTSSCHESKLLGTLLPITILKFADDKKKTEQIEVVLTLSSPHLLVDVLSGIGESDGVIIAMEPGVLSTACLICAALLS